MRAAAGEFGGMLRWWSGTDGVGMEGAHCWVRSVKNWGDGCRGAVGSGELQGSYNIIFMAPSVVLPSYVLH